MGYFSIDLFGYIWLRLSILNREYGCVEYVYIFTNQKPAGDIQYTN